MALPQHRKNKYDKRRQRAHNANNDARFAGTALGFHNVRHIKRQIAPPLIPLRDRLRIQQGIKPPGTKSAASTPRINDAFEKALLPSRPM
ncbi:MAG: hypothetical protein LBS96_05550 [Oscillospiraceae bacterium]|nr:hypothetical protein [Oscillospiraceae bacterium]